MSEKILRIGDGAEVSKVLGMLKKGAPQQEVLDQLFSGTTVETLKRIVKDLAETCYSLKQENENMRGALNSATSLMFAAAYQCENHTLMIGKDGLQFAGGPTAKLERFEDVATKSIVLRARL